MTSYRVQKGWSRFTTSNPNVAEKLSKQGFRVTAIGREEE